MRPEGLGDGVKHVRRDELQGLVLPGRVQQRAVGRAGVAQSDAVSVGFARYSDDAGPMEPHVHGEEVLYVIDTRDGWVEWGPEKDRLPDRRELARGDVLHVPDGEWHVLRHAPGGFVDILFVFAPPVW